MLRALPTGRLWKVCLAVLLLGGSAAIAAEWWDDSSLNPLNALVAHIEQQGPLDFDATMDAARKLTNGYSVHDIDRWHDLYAFHTPTVISLLRLSMLGVSSPPHLSCGPRTFALDAIVQRMGFATRVVHLFDTHVDPIQSHTYLEVSEDGRHWQIQDADYDVFYRSVHSGERTDTLALLTRHEDHVVPCTSPELCGWTEAGATVLRDHYREVVVYDVMRGGEAANRAVINVAAVDLAKRYEGAGGQTIEEILRNRYRVSDIRHVRP